MGQQSVVNPGQQAVKPSMQFLASPMITGLQGPTTREVAGRPMGRGGARIGIGNGIGNGLRGGRSGGLANGAARGALPASESCSSLVSLDTSHGDTADTEDLTQDTMTDDDDDPGTGEEGGDEEGGEDGGEGYTQRRGGASFDLDLGAPFFQPSSRVAVDLAQYRADYQRFRLGGPRGTRGETSECVGCAQKALCGASDGGSSGSGDDDARHLRSIPVRAKGDGRRRVRVRNGSSPTAGGGAGAVVE